MNELEQLAQFTDGTTSLVEPVTEPLAVGDARPWHSNEGEEWLTISRIEPLYNRRDGAAFRVHLTRGRSDD